MRAMPPEKKSPTALLTYAGWAVAAAFLLVLWIAHSRATRVKSDLTRVQGQVTGLTRDLAAERRWSVILSSSSMRTASFSRTPDADPGLRARAVMDPGSRRAVLVFENFKAPDGHSYELWALHGVTPASLGRIRTDPAGSAVMRIEDVGDPGDLTAFTISLESDGAAPAPSTMPGEPPPAREPSGPIVMIGSIGG